MDLFVQHKSDALGVIKIFHKMVSVQFDAQVKFIRSDNALEFDSDVCNEFFAAFGIIHQTSCPDRPQQNGRVERKHRHVLEMARALRFQASLPLHYWGDCVLTATHIINRLPTPVIGHKTPYEMLYHHSPSYSHLRVLGCLAFASNPSRSKDKFQPRGVPCVFLGYPNNQKGCKLLNMFTRVEFVSRDARLYEHIFPFQQTSFGSYIKPLPAPVTYSNRWTEDYLDSLYVIDNSSVSTPSGSPMTSHPSEESASTAVPQSSDITQSQSSTPTVPVIPPRRSGRQSKPPQWLADFVAQVVSTTPKHSILYPLSRNPTAATITDDHKVFLSALDEVTDPVHFHEAVTDPKWCSAMNLELRALEQNKTWDITSLPPGKRAIGCKWLYKTKFNSDGSIERYKARLVVLGCRQEYGVDYQETFAPVAKMTTVQTLLAVIAMRQWQASQMDLQCLLAWRFRRGCVHDSSTRVYTFWC